MDLTCGDYAVSNWEIEHSTSLRLGFVSFSFKWHADNLDTRSFVKKNIVQEFVLYKKNQE